MKIKVTRDGTGTWRLFSDVGPTGSYVLEGMATDNTYLSSSFAGVRCTYTAVVARSDVRSSPHGVWHVAVLATAKDGTTTLDDKAADFTVG